MICRSDYLRRYPTVFLKMTGLRLNEFADLLDDLLPRIASAEQTRLHRTKRRRAIGGGRHADLAARDQVLLSVMWERSATGRRVPQSGVCQTPDQGRTHDWSDAPVSKFESNRSPSSSPSHHPDTCRGRVGQSADTESVAMLADSGVGAFRPQPLF
jgi:hypothetical protein